MGEYLGIIPCRHGRTSGCPFCDDERAEDSNECVLSGGEMRIESPEQLANHILAGGEIEFKGSVLEYGNKKMYFPTDSVRFVVPNDVLMEFNVHDVIKLTQEQEVYTCE